MENDKSQRGIFLKSEGNRYYKRNAHAEHVALGYATIAKFVCAGDVVLEIGCSSGVNLSWLRKNFGCKAFGVDPSIEAIRAGRCRDRSLRLRVGTAEKLPYPSESCDVVVFGFCLYLVDRQFLSRVVAEADRVLRSGGYLAITDFEPNVPTLRAYKHRKGIFSYKCNYPAIFAAFPHFVIVDKMHYSHDGSSFVKEPGDRVATTVLFKDTVNAYLPLHKDA